MSNQVLQQYCGNCDELRIAPDHSIECLDGSAVLSLTLLSQQPLPTRTVFPLMVDGVMVEVTVCEGESCSPNTPTPQPGKESDITIPSVVVTTCVLLLLVGLALLLTVLITRCKRHHYWYVYVHDTV